MASPFIECEVEADSSLLGFFDSPIELAPVVILESAAIAAASGAYVCGPIGQRISKILFS